MNMTVHVVDHSHVDVTEELMFVEYLHNKKEIYFISDIKSVLNTVTYI